MARVEVLVEETPDGISAECCECNHMVEIPGVKLTDATKLQLLRQLHRTCPLKEDNRYVILDE